MMFPPRIIVVVVHHVGDRAADDLAHPLDHPFAAGVGIPAGQLHRRDVAAAEFAILVDHGRRNVHAVLAAGRLEITGRAGVAQSAAAEMHADPDVTGLVAHQIDIVISGSDGAQLGRRLLPELTHVGFTPGIAVIEQRMLDPLLVGAADAEGDHLRHVADDGAGRSAIALNGVSSRTAMLPQPMSKPTPEMLICFS